MAETEIKEVDESITDEAVSFLEGTAPFIMSKGFAPHVYSNEPYNPVPYGLLDLFYKVTHENRLGLMVALDTETNEPRLVLCMVGDKGEEDVDLFPIAALLKEEELTRYRAPLGNGEYNESGAE